MAVIEAMAAGVPVVASRVGGLPYQVEEGVTGRLARAGDPDAFADALAGLLAQPAAAAQMGAAARAIARRRFDPARVAGEYLALYRSVDDGR